MTPESSSNAALKPLLQMCEACEPSNVSTLRTLITKSLTHPEIFWGFSEIKMVVELKLASAPDADALIKTLDLFSYGTYKDYQSATMLNLTDAQVQKLKMLSVVTLVEQACIEKCGVLPYGAVAEELDLPADNVESLREVEELIIACIYANLVRGKLCQKTKTLMVSAQDGPPCRPRDVANVSDVLNALRGLHTNLKEAMAGLEGNKILVQAKRDAYAELMKKSKEANKGKTRATGSGEAAGSGAGAGWGGRRAARELSERASSAFRRQGKRSRGGGPAMDAFPRV